MRESGVQGRRIFAPAKINLALHVTGRRPDGYHELSSLVAFSQHVGDFIDIFPSEHMRLEVCGPFSGVLSAQPVEENLVWRAAVLLHREIGAGQGAYIRLEKHLPLASGIGGGSADAAAAARALNTHWGGRLSLEDLGVLLLPLGADIPMCLYGQTAMIHGIGEIISPIMEFPFVWAVLVNPGVPVPTAGVFRRYAEQETDFSVPLCFDSTQDIAACIDALRGMRNDLESAAIAIAPPVHSALSALMETPACLLARMSGSGATCVGLYARQSQAKEAAGRVATRHPGWWVRATALASAIHG